MAVLWIQGTRVEIRGGMCGIENYGLGGYLRFGMISEAASAV